MSKNIWWAVEGDPIFLANINDEETPSVVTFKDGIYQYLCPREGTPYTKVENIRRMKLVPLDDRTDLLTKLREGVMGMEKYEADPSFSRPAPNNEMVYLSDLLALLEKGGE